MTEDTKRAGTSPAMQELQDDTLDRSVGGFNPQPDPPGRHGAANFNPQPDPPGRHR